MKPTHRPDPKFVAHLERDLRLAVRREARFGNGASEGTSRPRQRRWSTVVVAFAAMFIGGAATFAVTRGLRPRNADLVIAKAEAIHEFATSRLELFREDVLETEPVADTQGIPMEYMRLELMQVETEAANSALDLQESRITGREADNSLSAPLLQGRDFVSERLELERSLLVERISLFDQEAAKHGPESDEALYMVREAEALQSALAIIDRRLALRHEYLAGDLTAREVELADMRFTVERERERATRTVDELRQHMDDAQLDLQDVDSSDSHARAMQLELRSAELQLRLAELELQALERKLADPPR